MTSTTTKAIKQSNTLLLPENWSSAKSKKKYWEK